MVELCGNSGSACGGRMWFSIYRPVCLCY